ncbi:MAG: AtpZ/AtpI family protein [Sphingobacteriaceae bacterium]
MNWIILRMQQTDPQKNKDRRNQMNIYAKYSGLGFQMIAIIGIFTFIGYKIDHSAAHKIAWVTAIMSLAGVFISLYIVIRSLKN